MDTNVFNKIWEKHCATRPQITVVKSGVEHVINQISKLNQQSRERGEKNYLEKNRDMVLREYRMHPEARRIYCSLVGAYFSQMAKIQDEKVDHIHSRVLAEQLRLKL